MAETPSPSSYSDAPPEEERSTSSFLILAVNLLLLAGALIWVIWRAKQSGPVQPGASAGTPTDVSRDGGGDGTGGGINPKTGGAGWATNVGDEDDPFSGRGGRGPAADGSGGGTAGGRVTPAGRRVLLARPTFDQLTQAQFLGLESGISALGPSIEVFRTVNGAYPPSGRTDYGANRGNEALVEILSQRGVFERVQVPLADTDGDGRKELVDPWGRPLVYFSHDDYESTQEITGGLMVGARERWVDDQKNWQGEQRFQLFSLGPNGKDDWGGYDDCNSWVTKQ